MEFLGHKIFLTDYPIPNGFQASTSKAPIGSWKLHWNIAIIPASLQDPLDFSNSSRCLLPMQCWGQLPNYDGGMHGRRKLVFVVFYILMILWFSVRPWNNISRDWVVYSADCSNLDSKSTLKIVISLNRRSGT